MTVPLRVKFLHGLEALAMELAGPIPRINGIQVYNVKMADYCLRQGLLNEAAAYASSATYGYRDQPTFLTPLVRQFLEQNGPNILHREKPEWRETK